jgi:hypothetical protein
MRRNRGELRAVFFRAVVFRAVAEVFFFVACAAGFFVAGFLGLVGTDWAVVDLLEFDAVASVLADCTPAGVANAEKPDASIATRVKSFRLNRIRRRWATTLFN